PSASTPTRRSRVSLPTTPRSWPRFAAPAPSRERYLADGGADLAVEGAQRVDHRVHGARARLEDGRGVQRHPLEAHLPQLDHAGHHAVVLGIEALALGIAGRRGDHALPSDG